jgi:AraC-like DNA-binding protein
VAEIAARVGFADSAYFSRVFRQITGVSPSAFRERQ